MPSQLASLVNEQQHLALLARAARYRARGQKVPYRLAILLAVIQNRRPSPPVDKRRWVDPRYVAKVRPGTGGGRRVRLASTSAGAGYSKEDVKEFTGRTPALSHLAGWARPGKRPTRQPELSKREVQRRARRDWLDLGERPVTVKPDDWELLRLTVMERMDAPEIAKLPAYRSLRAATIRKRIERVRARLVR